PPCILSRDLVLARQPRREPQCVSQIVMDLVTAGLDQHVTGCADLGLEVLELGKQYRRRWRGRDLELLQCQLLAQAGVEDHLGHVQYPHGIAPAARQGDEQGLRFRYLRPDSAEQDASECGEPYASAAARAHA